MRRMILISAAALVLAGAAHAKDDEKARKFLRDALQGDNSEMMLGKLAAQQADSPEAKRYGQMLVDDHTMHREKVVKVASEMGLPDDHQPMPAAEKERDKLSRLHGRDFDKEFAKYMVKDHRQDIGDYQKAARMSGAVGQLAQQTLPTLQKHLEAAERLGS